MFLNNNKIYQLIFKIIIAKLFKQYNKKKQKKKKKKTEEIMIFTKLYSRVERAR